MSFVVWRHLNNEVEAVAHFASRDHAEDYRSYQHRENRPGSFEVRRGEMPRKPAAERVPLMHQRAQRDAIEGMRLS